jgi:hypothetical protein
MSAASLEATPITELFRRRVRLSDCQRRSAALVRETGSEPKTGVERLRTSCHPSGLSQVGSRLSFISARPVLASLLPQAAPRPSSMRRPHPRRAAGRFARPALGPWLRQEESGGRAPARPLPPAAPPLAQAARAAAAYVFAAAACFLLRWSQCRVCTRSSQSRSLASGSQSELQDRILRPATGSRPRWSTCSRSPTSLLG